MYVCDPEYCDSLQVTTLVNQKTPSNKKKGRSKKAHVLSAAVQKATENFIIQGEEIANENPEIRNDMLDAVDEVRKTGKCLMSKALEKQQFFLIGQC